MKKVLLSAVTVLGLSFEANAYDMPTTVYGTIPSHVIMDTRPLVNAMQTAARNMAPGIQAALAQAEALGYINYSEKTILLEGSFAGTDEVVVKGDKSLTFRVKSSEILSGTDVTGEIKYTATSGPEGFVSGWTCTSTVGYQNLGANYIKGNVTALDPVLDGLGWPFSGCTVVASM
ncbi:MAG: hypothetical protein FJX18_06795 [Alphaproteobacteria bacterium]|nr:hypothetical protein [Alphaproteobacteria bacterium]